MTRASVRKLTRAAFVPAALLVALPAQGWYRGDEYEQRDFPVDAEYFVDRIGVAPSFEDAMTWWRATNAYLGAAGSYTRRDLFNMQALKIDVPLADRFRFSFDFGMDQDFDGIYDHYLLGIGYPLSDTWTAALVGEPLARKEFADIGVRLTRQTDASKVSVLALAPNFEFASKNDMDGRFVRQPFNLQCRGVQALNDRLDLLLNIDLDFPSETRYDDTAFDFEYTSYKPAAGLLWTLNERDALWGMIGMERTDKTRASFDGTDPDDFDTRRTAHSARIEWMRDRPDRTRYTVGLEYETLNEDNDYPNHPADPETLGAVDHTTRMAYGTVRWPVTGGWFVDSGLYLDWAHHEDTYPEETPDRRQTDSSGLEGKMPIGFEWMGETFRLRGGVSFQVDEIKFGGGYAGARVVF